MSYVLADVAEVACIPKRSVRLWADAGVIVADSGTMHEGSGTHRRFSRVELIIACIVAPFAKQKLAIGALKALARNIRLSLSDKGTRPAYLPLVEGAIRGDANFLHVHWSDPKGATGADSDSLLISGVTISPATWTKLPVTEALSLRATAPIKIDIVRLERVLSRVPRE